MVDIRPFQGFYCNPEKYSPSDFITPPYDKISPELAEKFYAKDFNNIHLILGRILPGDNDSNNRYVRAKSILETWLKEQRLIRSGKPCFYLYRQDFKYKTDSAVVRRGVIGLLKLENPSGEGAVKPHEHTLAKPKEDRLKLLRATRANFGQIFMLYKDEADRTRGVFERTEKHPVLVRASDECGDQHRIWEITDPDDISQFKDLMRDQNLVIADGHHRYETSCTYQEEVRKNLKEISGEIPEDFIMVTLVNMCQKDLLILPTHRLVHSPVPWQVFQSGLEKLFVVEQQWALDDPRVAESAETFLRTHREETAFVLCVKANKKALGLCLRNGVDPLKVRPRPGSQARQKLDIAILHELVLEDLLGINEEMLRQESHVGYEREMGKALKMLTTKDYQYLFFVNPTPVKSVVEIAENRDRMPQKSTDFYPKLYSGLIIRKL